MECRGVCLVAVLSLAVIAISSSAIIYRLLYARGVGPETVTFWRLALSVPILLALAGRVPRPGAWCKYSAVGGVALAVHFVSWFLSLERTSVAVSTTLVSTYPLFTLFIGRSMGEPVTRVTVLGVGITFMGIAVTSLAAGLSEGDPLGPIMALVGSISGALYFSMGKLARQSANTFDYAVITYATAMLVAFAIATVRGAALHIADGETLLLLLAMTAGPMLAGHTAINYLLGYGRLTVITASTLGEPVGATLLAMGLLGEYPPIAAYLGMGITLTGIGMLLVEENRLGARRRE